MEKEKKLPFENFLTYINLQSIILALISNPNNKKITVEELIDKAFLDIYSDKKIVDKIQNKNQYIFNVATAIYVVSMFSFYLDNYKNDIKKLIPDKYDKFAKLKLETFGLYKHKNDKLENFGKKLRIALAHHNINFYKNNDIEFINYDFKDKEKITYKIKMSDRIFLKIVAQIIDFVNTYISLKLK